MLNNTDKVLGDIEDALRSMDTSAADEALKADLHRKIQAAIDALKVQLEAAEDEALKAQLETAIADLEALDALVDTLEPSALQGTGAGYAASGAAGAAGGGGADQ